MRGNYLVIGALLFIAGCSPSISSPFVGKWEGTKLRDNMEYQRVEFKGDGTFEITFKSKLSGSMSDRGTWKKIDDKSIEFTADFTEKKPRVAKLIDDVTMEAAIPFKDPGTYERRKPK